jgi:hypothetical protein
MSNIITGILVNDTDSSLKLFFENERRNGGGPVTGMIVNHDLQAAACVKK